MDKSFKGRKTVTYEELVWSSRKVKSIKTWARCVSEAKNITVRVKGNRMTVAAIALRACEIKNGGDRGSADFKAGKSNRGLAAFAREVGISSYSLYRWVGVRRYVYDQRKSKSEKFSFTMAHRAYSSKRTSGPDTCIELYEQMMSDPHANNKAISESNFKRIKWAHRFFNKNPPKRYLPKYMVEEAKEKLEDLVEIFS